MTDLTDHHCALPATTGVRSGNEFTCYACRTVYVAWDDTSGLGTGLMWVRKDNIPIRLEGEPTTEATDAETGEDHVIHTRVDLVPAKPGVATPLFLDLGSDNAIVVQPKPDQKDGELALNVLIGGGIDLEVVAWILHQASDAIVHGIQQARFDLEVPR